MGIRAARNSAKGLDRVLFREEVGDAEDSPWAVFQAHVQIVAYVGARLGFDGDVDVGDGRFAGTGVAGIGRHAIPTQDLDRAVVLGILYAPPLAGEGGQ